MNRQNPFNWGCYCTQYTQCSACKVRSTLSKEDREKFLKEVQEERRNIE